MASISFPRVILSSLAGGLAWFFWSTVVNLWGIGSRYAAAQQSGQFLSQPRYSFFVGVWILMTFLISYIIAWLYAGLSQVYGRGLRTALSLGLLVGFVAGFPMNFALATWLPVERIFPLWWMLELWIGCIIAALATSLVYRDKKD